MYWVISTKKGYVGFMGVVSDIEKALLFFNRQKATAYAKKHNILCFDLVQYQF